MRPPADIADSEPISREHKGKLSLKQRHLSISKHLSKLNPVRILALIIPAFYSAADDLSNSAFCNRCSFSGHVVIMLVFLYVLARATIVGLY